MTYFFREDNSESTIELYNKKRIYDSIIRGDSPNLVNFQFAEKALYGRVDRFFRPMVLSNYVPLQLKGFGAEGTPVQGARALNFVADAFADLRNQFLKKTLTNEISPNEEFLSSPIVYKAHVSSKKTYDDYIQIYLEAFQNVAKAKSLVFENFQDFIDVIMPFLMKTIRKKPFTYTAFVKSTFCPINASGLVVEIADIDPVNDVEKVKKFIKSPNWQFYLTTCGNFGFMVDRNTPWRLVADIGSASMLQYAERYGVYSTDGVLVAAYTQAHKNYLTTFRSILYTMYMKLKKPRYSRYVEVDPSGGKVVMITPKLYKPEDYLVEFPDSYFLNLYCKIRLEEEESPYSDAQRYQLIDNTLELAQANAPKAIQTFETIVNKTFDYNGSLSYIKDTLAKLRE
jgi:hypothetical protein